MSYRPHTLVAFGGTLPETDDTTQNEIWECTVRGYSPGGSQLPLSDPNGYMEQMAPALSAWFSNASHNMANTARLTYVKVNNINANGEYSDPGATNRHDFTPVAGGGVHSMPSYLTLAFSWTTAFLRGPAHAGRIFPPNFVGNFAGAAVSQTTVDAAVAAATSLLDCLRQHDGDLGFIPIVASKIGAATHEIQGVRVGNIIDRQSRRRNAVAETYTAASWNSGG